MSVFDRPAVISHDGGRRLVALTKKRARVVPLPPPSNAGPRAIPMYLKDARQSGRRVLPARAVPRLSFADRAWTNAMGLSVA